MSTSKIKQTISSTISHYISFNPQTIITTDLEKNLRSPSISPSYSPISPSSPLLRASTHSPIPNSRSKSTRQEIQQFGYTIRIRRVKTWFIRILCGCVVLTILTMTSALSGMQSHTTRKLSKHLDSSAIWESFPVMQSYYRGLYELIPRSENTPENTGPMNVPKATLSSTVSPTPTPSPTPSSTPSNLPKHGVLPPQPDLPLSEEISELEKELDSAPEPNFHHQNATVGAPHKKLKKIKPLPPSIPYDPYPTIANRISCTSLITNFTSSDITVHAYRGIPRGFPNPFYGSYETLQLDDEVCFERRTRLGVYGYKDLDEIPGNVTTESLRYDLEWEGVDWKGIQDECVRLNNHRFISHEDEDSNAEQISGEEKEEKSTKGRTAVVLRVWHSYNWTRLDYVNLRSLISELNIGSGGEYDVHLLMHVQDQDIPIWTEKTEYERVVRESVGAEFRGLVTLWNEKMMLAQYPRLGGDWRGLPIHGAYRSLWLPLQYFARQHPEYEHFWNLEMDVRYTGHWYHFLEKVTKFAKAQPRRGLWERNSRFYVPSVHGSWSDFGTMVANEADESERVWGPIDANLTHPAYTSITPPFATAQEDEKYEWGVDEEADLITLTPIFNPKNTTWGPRDDFTGYGAERPEGVDINPFTTGPERRASVVAMYRFSRRLLDMMHYENTFLARTMFTEMWPSTVALQYGLKAVYAPHPVFMDRRWPGRYLSKVLNNGAFGSSGGAERSVFGRGEHHFRGSGFYYGSYWPRGVYRSWIGVGEEWEGRGGEEWEEEKGRMCLPGMLLHPVKDL
ncbi:hypothetical protein TWF694_003534 [Orbilia ellipsospora]|uniref:Uncharacterized protein n=1 Tax=Orbilia ellipsospora TaxID=2528407 RepID=A0AAV9WZT7_9PEZI